MKYIPQLIKVVKKFFSKTNIYYFFDHFKSPVTAELQRAPRQVTSHHIVHRAEQSVIDRGTASHSKHVCVLRMKGGLAVCVCVCVCVEDEGRVGATQ